MLIERYLFQPPPAVPCSGFALRGACGHTFQAQYHEGAAERQGPARVVLYSHGNGDDLATIESTAAAIAAQGYSVLTYDYCGYGYWAQSKPCEACCYACAEAAIEWLLKRNKVENIVLWGHSMGGGPSCWLAMHYRVAGLILQAAFFSVQAMIEHKVGCVAAPLTYFIHMGFPNCDYLEHVICPVLVMHGTRDTIVPVAQGIALAWLTNAQTWMPPRNHNDLEGDSEFWPAVKRFLHGLEK